MRALLVAASIAVAALGLAAPAAADPPPDLPPVVAPPPSSPPPPAKPAAAPPALPVPTFAPQPYPTWTAPGPFPPGYPGGYPGGAMPAYTSPYNPAEYAIPPPPPRRRYSPGMHASGVALVVVGLSSVITGAALISSATNRIDVYCDTPSFPCAHLDDTARRNGGIATMAVGAVMSAVGVPLWIVGSKLVPLAPQAAPAAAIHFGPAQAKLTIRF